MTKMVYSIAWCIVILILLYCCNEIKKKEDYASHSLLCLMGAGIFSVTASGVAVIASSETMAYIGNSFFYGSIYWLLLAFLIYVQVYVKNMYPKLWARIFLYGLGGIDFCSFLLNIKFHHIFSLEKIFYGGSSIYCVVSTGLYFKIHLLECYMLSVMIFIVLIYKILHVPRLYRVSYQMVMMFFLVVLGLDGSVMLFSLPINISIFFYALLGAIISYYTLSYSPKGIMERMLTQVVKNINSGLICYDVEGKCIYVNTMGKEMFSLCDDEEKLEKYREIWLQTAKLDNPSGKSWKEQHLVDGETRYYEAEYHIMTDEHGDVIGDYFKITDRTEETTRYDRERYRATHDALTGIYNRSYFYERVEERLKAEPDKSYYMVCSNICDFKLINDLFGEEKGDEVLKKQVEILKKYASPSTIFGRIGGDKFAVLIEKELYNEEIFQKGIRMMQTLFTNQAYRMHIHMGVYEIENHEDAAAVICDRANIAINSIKNDYDKNVVYYNKEIIEHTMEEKRIMAEFEEALEKEQFRMYLQPQMDVDGKTKGGEALVRWQHPGRGMIPPSEFLEVLENVGLIWKLDKYIWEKAAAKLKDWKDKGKTDWYISVNISTRDFYYVDVYRTFTDLVKRYEIPTENLKLEITESVFISEADKVFDIIEKLRGEGFQIEIDDFGSGYSSLNLLKDFHADVIKLDMGFLAETLHAERCRIIMEYVVSMAKKLGMFVIAEGVESEEQLKMLHSMGCDLYQGYYFAKPMQADYFEMKYM